MIEDIVIALASGLLTALTMAFIGRRKARADTYKTTVEAYQIESETRQSAISFYQEQVEKTIKQMRILEAEVKELKSIIETAQGQYERRVGSLHEQLDRIGAELDRANAQLKVANETIAELRKEVKNGNAIITELTQLLTKAEKKGDK